MQLFAFVTKSGETFIGLATIQYEWVGPPLRKRQYVDVKVHGMVLGTIGRNFQGVHITTTQDKAPRYHIREQVGKIKKVRNCMIHHLVSSEKLLLYKHQ